MGDGDEAARLLRATERVRNLYASRLSALCADVRRAAAGCRDGETVGQLHAALARAYAPEGGGRDTKSEGRPCSGG